ncbi:MAG: CapA family protein [Ignavibacteriaceae bacterium]
MKKRYIHFGIILLVISTSAIILFGNKVETQDELNVIVPDSTVTVTVSFVGDLMCHSTQFNYAKVENDSFDFRPVYREIKNVLAYADFTIGNLETVTAGRSASYSGYPFFNSPDDFIVALKDAGFDLLITSNNHSLDKGEKGVLRTIEQIKLNNLQYTGTFNSESDRDSIRVVDLNGIKIAILSYTYGTNGIPKPKGKDYIVNLIDYSLIESDIKKARTNTELVLVYFHFGEEYQRLPNQYQKDVVNNTIIFGADIIIGSHPHVIQPVDYYKTSESKLENGFIAYSLGNFISNQRWRYSDAGVILNIELTKNFTTDSIFISDVNYIPTWVFRGNTNAGKEYIILPSQKYSDTTYQFLSISERQLMKQAFYDTRSVLTQFSDDIKLMDVK